MPQDTRKDPRAKVLSLNVRYKSATVDEFIEHHSHDISKGGIFIKTPSPFPAGTLLKFEIRIREDQPLIAGVGRVVWKREPPQASAERPAGMGVKFIKLDGHSRELIDRIIADRKSDGPVFEETADGNPPSMRPPAVAAPAPANTVSGAGGGNFFPSGPPAEQPPPQERTVIKQADEILADALKGAGLADANAGVAPIELPKPSSTAPPARKATLLGMPAAPGEGMGMALPPEVAAAAREYEAKHGEPAAPAAKAIESPPPEPSAPASEPPAPASEPSAPEPEPARAISDRPAAKVASEPPAPRASDRPSPASAPPRSVSERPRAAAAAPMPAEKSGTGALGWLVLLVLIGAAGAGGYYLMTKNAGTPASTPTPAASPSPATTPSPAATPSESVEPTPTATEPEPTPSVVPSASAAPSASVAPAPSPSPAMTAAPPPPTTAAPPPPPPPTTAAPPPPPPPTTAAPPPPPPPTTAKPPPPPPPPTTAKPPPPPKPKGDDNPYN